MDITRNQPKNEFDDCHDHMHVCVLMYRSGLSRNSFIQMLSSQHISKEMRVYIQCLVNTRGMY